MLISFVEMSTLILKPLATVKETPYTLGNPIMVHPTSPNVLSCTKYCERFGMRSFMQRQSITPLLQRPVKIWHR